MILAAKDIPSTGTNTLIWRVDGNRTIEHVIFSNRNNSQAFGRLWFVPTNTPLDDAYRIGGELCIPANSPIFFLDHTMTLALTEEIWAYSTLVNVNVLIIGR